MAPARILRRTFSQTSACSPGFVSCAGSITKPAVLSFSLWHVVQYFSKTAGGRVCGVCAPVVSRTDPRRTNASTTFLVIVISRNILFAQRGTHEKLVRF